MWNQKELFIFSARFRITFEKKKKKIKPNSLIAGEDIILTRCQFFITNTMASLGMKVCCPIPSNSLIFAEFFPLPTHTAKKIASTFAK